MALETVEHIDDLDASNPGPNDPASQGDDHIRNIKRALRNTFPNITGAINWTAEQLNSLIPSDQRIETSDGVKGGGEIGETLTLSVDDTVARLNSDGNFNNSITIERNSSGDEIEIFHSGNHAYIDNKGSGNIILRFAGTNTMMLNQSGDLTISGNVSVDGGRVDWSEGSLEFYKDGDLVGRLDQGNGLGNQYSLVTRSNGDGRYVRPTDTLDYVQLSNKEASDYNQEGRIWFDSSSGVITKADNADYTDAAPMWYRGNVTLESPLQVNYDSENCPSLYLGVGTNSRDWVQQNLPMIGHTAVGTYIMAAFTGFSSQGFGDVVEGRKLSPTYAGLGSVPGGSNLPGQWRCHGASSTAGTPEDRVTLWQRIS